MAEYAVFATGGKEKRIIPLFQAVDTPQKYEGMLVNGTGNVVSKGDRFNGKYIMVAPYNKPDKSMMVYVTNFHSMYQQFDFESLSVGDEVRITGVLSLYNPDSKSEEESTYKIHLRTPDDLTPIGITQSQITLWGSIGLLLVLLVIGWIISLRSSVKNKTEDLQESLNDKEILLKEIHHRIKNNLAIMSGLFELQLEGVENEETKKVLRDSQSRLKSMALVHDKLYRTSTLTDIEMYQYITDLVRSLRNTFAGTHQEINPTFDLDDISLDIDQAIPCGLLINEIVVNAFKHAFNNKKTGVIRISLKHQGGTIKLVIADNGEGIPDDIDLGNRSSLGMMLIDTFKKQLEATMDVSNTNGTQYSITFPAD
jgi:two-component sensor histidine kinase